MGPRFHLVLQGSLPPGFLLAPCWLVLTPSLPGVVVLPLLPRARGRVGDCACVRAKPWSHAAWTGRVGEGCCRPSQSSTKPPVNSLPKYRILALPPGTFKLNRLCFSLQALLPPGMTSVISHDCLRSTLLLKNDPGDVAEVPDEGHV